MILSPVTATADYAGAMGAACPDARIICKRDDLSDALAGYELSDVLLVLDPRCFAVGDRELSAFFRHFSAEQQIAHHLVAFEAGAGGPKEHVDVDARGLVRSVHRYYAPTTWPFIAGVSASLVPVSTGALASGFIPTSLLELRQFLVARGVSIRDVPLEGSVLDLTKLHGLLAATELFVLQAAGEPDTDRPSRPILIGEGHAIDPRTRIVGPVVIHQGATIQGHATIVGPTLVGAGACIGSGALVAHSLVGPGSSVPVGAVVRDRVWFGGAEGRGAERPGPIVSYGDRLARLAVESQEPGTSDGAVRGSRGQHLALKRALDVIVASVALLLLAPVFFLIALAIWVESRRPIFYGGEREGLRGRVFSCWKFRTMRIGADAVQHQLKSLDKMDGPHFKLDSDPRVTRVGRLLRLTNFDELPQLWNVLRGHMSLVGPRPSPFRENQICVPWREGRLSVRPGVTGLWQVCRQDRSSGDFHQWIEYDLLYVQRMTFAMDLKILVATFLTLGGKIPVPVGWIVSGEAPRPHVWMTGPSADADLTQPTSAPDPGVEPVIPDNAPAADTAESAEVVSRYQASA
jgi:lipopolysaccharide/colanic/teichoic acid biosynthesis glycosyltransferase